MRQAKSIFLTALAALAFAACNKEEAAGTGSPGEALAGEETYVSFNFKVEGNKTNTRGKMPAEAGDESTVADGRILIFDETSGTLLNNEPLTISGADANMTIKTTSGSRRIYVIMGTDGKPQITGRLDGLTPNTSKLSDFYALMTDGEYATGPDTDMGDGFKELFVNGKFVMSNVADLNAVKTLHPNISKEQSATGGAGSGAEDLTVNRFEFNVLRAVAKGALKVQFNKQESLTTADGIFTLKKDATYGIRNVNRGTLYVQQYINDKQTANAHDHDLTGGLRPFAAFYKVFDNETSANLKLPSTYKPYYFGGYDIKGNDAVQIVMKAKNETPAAAFGTPVYFSENSNNQQLRGNTTYFGIATQVEGIAADDIAGEIKTDDLNNISSEAAAAPYTTGDFWYIPEIPADIQHMLTGKVRRVFTDETIAFQAMDVIAKHSSEAVLTTTGFTKTDNYTHQELKDAYHGSGGKGPLNDTDKAIIDKYLKHYKDGYSYYRLNLYEKTADGTRRHLVRRNHNYQATITSFATIGVPTEEDLDKDPEKPVDEDVTNVTAIITVVAWHDIAMEDDL